MIFDILLMKNKIKKLEAHASHLLDGIIALKGKYAIFEPLIFNQDVITLYGNKERNRGFEIIKNTLFFSCAQDIAKFCMDSDAQKRTPSIKSLTNELTDTQLIAYLRENYATRAMPSVENETDPLVLEELRNFANTENIKRGGEFDHHLNELIFISNELFNSKLIVSFKTIRDKVSAHTESRLSKDEYQLVDISKLGIKWIDIKTIIDEMQRATALINFIIRRADFAWDNLDKQFTTASTDFWRI